MDVVVLVIKLLELAGSIAQAVGDAELSRAIDKARAEADKIKMDPVGDALERYRAKNEPHTDHPMAEAFAEVAMAMRHHKKRDE